MKCFHFKFEHLLEQPAVIWCENLDFEDWGQMI